MTPTMSSEVAIGRLIKVLRDVHKTGKNRFIGRDELRLVHERTGRSRSLPLT